MNSQDLCAKIENDLINAGEFITVGDALESIGKHFERNEIDPATDEAIFSFVFGLDKFQQLINRINTYNTNHSNVGDKIHGVRIYYSAYKRKDSSSYGTTPYPDLIIMPILKNAEDLYKDTSNKNIPDSIILSDSRPCPTLCIEKSIISLL